ncbi:efflux RND transporter periplasmic adaptor subunit [Desulfuromonas sp. AOP6]|uniref:efflux RND transporter periplasmic adaptor subunit n=1 Tax=Desulfuromonas sp. AOP6 TaxID=1566351 RepID=UPI001279D981|nr:efflux RND transporter periplasmic adaptor subunit [Desulfuromonas sp. AOP6]BCA80243.1 MexE family multidrug efflux RND transporterperiplasmic adaptor subunit [Desulfuromonas sp. AOP6]
MKVDFCHRSQASAPEKGRYGLPVRWSLTLLSLALLLGCSDKENPQTFTAAERPGQIPTVEVQVLQPENLEETFTLPGTLEAWEDLTLSVEVAGTVRQIGPQEGDQLKAGATILHMDTDILETSLERAEADYRLRQKELERIRRLREQNFVSAQEFDTAINAFDVADAELKRLRTTLEKSALRTPVTGRLDRLLVDRGEYVKEGTAAAVVIQIDRLKVLIEVPEKDVAFVKIGDQVRIEQAAIEGLPQIVLPGKIIHLAYKADASTKTYLAKIEVSNGTGLLRPGMIVRTRIVRRSLPDVLAVPLYAVVEREGQKFLFVEEGGAVFRRPVELGAVIGDKVVILSGVEAGERLVVKGQQLMTHGAKVKVAGD